MPMLERGKRCVLDNRPHAAMGKAKKLSDY
jgi:hypothetical protein